MKTPVAYLYPATLDEVAARLKSEGYEVTIKPSGPDEGFDLVARRNGKRMAVKVRTTTDLNGGGHELGRLRKKAQEQGYDDFWLVVVRPPGAVAVEVEGIAEQLHDWLFRHFPANLAALSSATVLEQVTRLEIDTLEVSRQGSHVIGMGVVVVSLEGESGHDFPFSFDVLLNQNLQIQEVRRIRVDTSSYEE